MHPKGAHTVAPGRHFTMRDASGGRFGAPSNRPRAKVLTDVEGGLVTLGTLRAKCMGERFRREFARSRADESRTNIGSVIAVVSLAMMIKIALDSHPDTHWIAALLGPEGTAARFAARASEPDSETGAWCSRMIRDESDRAHVAIGGSSSLADARHAGHCATSGPRSIRIHRILWGSSFCGTPPSAANSDTFEAWTLESFVACLNVTPTPNGYRCGS